MKKFYFTLITLFFSFSVLAQTFTLKENVEWDKNNQQKWSKPNAWDPSNPLNGGSGTLVIPKGLVLTLYGEFKWNGTIEVYGTIVFYQNTDRGGKLTMNSTSTIRIADGGALISDGPGNSDGTKNVLTIGDTSISGGSITATGTGPNELNQDSLDEGGCVKTGCSFTPLPVNLIYFKATTKNQSVEITWASSKAWDFSHYELERSADGLAFDYVATIDAAEFSNETIEYTYSDHQPLSGTSYYRLKAVDIDGAFEYKDMAAVKFGAESFKVYPNPSVNGFINLDWSHAVDGATVVLRDHAGRTVLTTSLKGNKNTISTAGLNPGIYLLSIHGPAGSKQAQVMIK